MLNKFDQKVYSAVKYWGHPIHWEVIQILLPNSKPAKIRKSVQKLLDLNILTTNLEE